MHTVSDQELATRIVESVAKLEQLCNDAEERGLSVQLDFGRTAPIGCSIGPDGLRARFVFRSNVQQSIARTPVVTLPPTFNRDQE